MGKTCCASGPNLEGSYSQVFIRLTPRELALLALTCRAMNYIVGQYLQHYTASFGLK